MSVQTKTKTKGSNAGKITTPEFRVSFPSVFQARAVVEGQEPKYSIVMLFSKKTDISVLNQLVKAAVIEKWGPDKAKWPRDHQGNLKLRLPIRDGSEKDYTGYGSDVVFATASSKMRPGIVGPDMQPIIEPGEFYGGCWARASITAFAYDVKGNRGVAFGLRNIQKLRDDEAFSGAGKPEDDFDAIEAPAGNGVDGNAASDPLKDELS